jgi:hypothetical protein
MRKKTQCKLYSNEVFLYITVACVLLASCEDEAAHVQCVEDAIKVPYLATSIMWIRPVVCVLTASPMFHVSPCRTFTRRFVLPFVVFEAAFGI